MLEQATDPSPGHPAERELRNIIIREKGDLAGLDAGPGLTSGDLADEEYLVDGMRMP